jgi:O-antigen ligase
MIKYTGKNILSGREHVWETLLFLIKQQPFFGYGSGALLRDFIDTSLSAHNLYLQVSLQIGLIGLGLLVLILTLVWMMYLNGKGNPKVRLVASFFIGTLTYQLFEVTLTQNNFGLAIIQWVIIGLGISYAVNNDEQLEDN